MAETSIIREFLVKLGFATDEPALKKFEGGISTATRSVVALASAIEITALAVVAGVSRFTSGLEALYFAAQRTGASATNLKALDLAAQNFGTSIGEAVNSAEGLARSLRTNPGTEGILKSLGIQTRDVNGNLRDTTDLLTELGTSLREKFSQNKNNTMLASQYGSLLGIDEKTMLAILDPKFSSEFAKRRREMQNTGFEKATADAHKFEEQLRTLGVYIEAFGIKVYDALANKLGVSIADVTQWLKVNGPEAAQKFADAIVKIMDAAEWLIRKVIEVIDKLKEWDKATGGLSTQILALILAMKFLGGFQILGAVASTVSALATLAKGFAGAAMSGAGLVGVFGAILSGLTALGAGVAVGWGFDKLFPNNWLAKFGEYMSEKVFKERHKREDTVFRLSDMGWSQGNAAGMAANLEAESSLNPFARNGSHYGLAQWDESRQKDFEKWSGHKMTDTKDSDAALTEQLAFMDYELRQGRYKGVGAELKTFTGAADSADILTRGYEIPASQNSPQMAAEVVRRQRIADAINRQVWAAPDTSASSPISGGSILTRGYEIPASQNSPQMAAPDTSASSPISGGSLDVVRRAAQNATSETPTMDALLARARGSGSGSPGSSSGAPTINLESNVTVHGADKPQETAELVKQYQQRSLDEWAQTLRNFKTAAQ